MFKVYNKNSCPLKELENNSVDSLITDPPYGISYQHNYWDKDLPKKEIWENSLLKVKPGGFGLVFSSVRLMHRLMVDLEDSGFLIKDVLFWSYLNGMPKSRNVGLLIDNELGVESEKAGEYKYVQGYKKDGADNYKTEHKHKLTPSSDIGKKYDGAGLGVKPAYEPIILIQKPLEKGLNIAQNILKFGTGSLNFEGSRLPYEKGEGKVGHNPHEKGRVPANIIRTDEFNDGYDKFFLVPKVRQHKEDFNFHPTLKPVGLMHQLVNLATFENQTVLDPFMGSGSTGIACIELKREFVGYELDESYYKIAERRLEAIIKTPKLF
ncbi:MAG TPA: site-specific DNA-methyltransferase [Flavobacteriales bacterium]|nr:site-specific DNA-methyltransferase [Flavobacteriales bacterium]HIN39682.1 site-specific DNA-methyltransferase [Flavobacteriales bacterium]